MAKNSFEIELFNFGPLYISGDLAHLSAEENTMGSSAALELLNQAAEKDPMGSTVLWTGSYSGLLGPFIMLAGALSREPLGSQGFVKIGPCLLSCAKVGASPDRLRLLSAYAKISDSLHSMGYATGEWSMEVFENKDLIELQGQAPFIYCLPVIQARQEAGSHAYAGSGLPI
ncbi:MAG: hypothetical protein FWG10_05045 [Eubacteriaceae bacterium]|nr:hypothetical protein [Eubacteriaceae bacterium]